MLGKGIKRAPSVCFHAHTSYYNLMDVFKVGKCYYFSKS
jgi:hypothetical protein